MTSLAIAGRQVALSNLDKVMYPATGMTKAQVIDYYIRVAPQLLPHLRKRPLTMKRYPNGVQGEHFYQKRCPANRPPWVGTARVPSKRAGGEVDTCVINDLATLVWAANLADLELHPSLARAPAFERPTVVAFDLDPGPPAGLVACCAVALRLRQLLHRLGLESFPKTSGAKGLQVYVPLNTPRVTYDETKTLARFLAELLQREHPDEVEAQMKKSLRPGKVFIDWSQNDKHKTTVCVYSLRATARPRVSTPVTWDEVARTAATGDAERLVFEADDVLARVRRRGDLFAPVERLRQRLPSG